VGTNLRRDEQRQRQVRRTDLIKTNASGDTVWTRTYGTAEAELAKSVQQTEDGGYIVTGNTTTYGNYDVYLIRTDSSGDAIWSGTYGRATPNPFISFGRIPGHEAEQFDLYDISGKWRGACRGDRVGEKLSPGVYFISPAEARSQSVRIVKVR
jgi:hypothetical protein